MLWRCLLAERRKDRSQSFPVQHENFTASSNGVLPWPFGHPRSEAGLFEALGMMIPAELGVRFLRRLGNNSGMSSNVYEVEICGTFRAAYKTCHLIPAPLMPNGKYMGPVYVIGVVVKKLVPGSKEDADIGEDVKNLGGRLRDKFVKVSWRKMGLLDELNSATRHKINVDQGTIRGTIKEIFKEAGPGNASFRKELLHTATQKMPSSSEEWRTLARSVI